MLFINRLNFSVVRPLLGGVLLSLALAQGAHALANDTSFAAIEVDSINTNAKVGTEMSFKGEEARKVMGLLPRIDSTGGPKYNEHHRVLAIKSPGYMITLSCHDLEFGANPNGPLKTPECFVSFNARIDESNTLPFIPEKQCK